MNHISMIIGWTLLHFVWQAAVVIVVYKCIEWPLRHAKPASRYALALIALLSMALAAIGTLSYEAEVLQPVSRSSGATNMPHPADIQRIRLVQRLVIQATERVSLNHFMLSLDLLWVCGVLVLTMRTVGGFYALRRIRTKSWEAPPLMIVRLRALMAKMNLGRSVAVRLHPYIASPFVAGSIRSVIYLPVSAFTHLDPDHLDTIVAHELAHIRRADFTWNLVQTVIETFFFFHPAVWYLSATLQEQRELCCDDAVLATGIEPLKYAKALLALANLTSTPAVVMAAKGHQSYGLLPRVARILDNYTMTNRTLRLGSQIRYLLTGVALAVMLIPLFTTSPLQAANQASLSKPVWIRGDSMSNSDIRTLIRPHYQYRFPKFTTTKRSISRPDESMNPSPAVATGSSDFAGDKGAAICSESASSSPGRIPRAFARADAHADAHAAAHARMHVNVHFHVRDNRHPDAESRSIQGIKWELDYGS